MDELDPPRPIRLRLGPGSRQLSPGEPVVVEWGREEGPPALWLGDRAVPAASMATLSVSKTGAGHLLELPASWLLERAEALGVEADALDPLLPPLELTARLDAQVARMEICLAPPRWRYEGDPSAPMTMLITGFAPFPAGGGHDNVSAVAVRAMRPDRLKGVRLVRAILPVEYDHAPARLRQLIDACAPDRVICFGQGRSEIALEQRAYNLKRAVKTPGGTPDNRGVIALGEPIEPGGPEARACSLPLDAIAGALRATSEPTRYSADPGRYICNNVFYEVMSRVEHTEALAGFVHLPCVTAFDDEVAAHWAGIVEIIVQAVVDHER